MPDADDAASGPQRRGLGRVIGRVAPTVIRQIDLDEVVAQLDVNAIAEQLDIDALLDRVDLDVLVERLDVNAIAMRLDMNDLASRLDVNALAMRLDMNDIANRLDVQAIAARMDMNDLAGRLDLDAVVARVDVAVLMDRLDMNAVAERLDLDQLVSRVNMAQLTAGATQDVAASGLDLARRQLMRADSAVDRGVSKVLRRTMADRPVAPGAISEMVAVPTPPHSTTFDAPEPADTEAGSRRDVSGHYAGFASRLVALGADITAAVAVFGMIGSLGYYLINTVTDVDTTLGSSGWIQQALITLWLLVWFWLPVTWFGRTPAMALVGLAVLARDGTAAGGRRALLRSAATPFSLAVFGVGLIGIVAGRERRALHDVVSGTCVVYDWGARDAEMPVSIREQLTARVQRRQAQQSP